VAKAWVTTDLHVQDFHSGQFGKTNQQQEEALQKDGLASLSAKEKEKMMTGFLNAFTFSNKSSIEQRVAKTLARVDISEVKKVDITTKVKGLGLTTLGASIHLVSATSEGETRAATGRIASFAARTAILPANKLLDDLDGLWREVIKIAPEITWLHQTPKEPWPLKLWAVDEEYNPPKCLQWAKKLKTKEVEARLAHYVDSPAPQARHARLRLLLPLLADAMTAYRTTKNLKTNSDHNPRRALKKK
jgi:hypothetical protein